MDLPHSTVVGVVVGIVRDERLVEQAQLVDFVDRPQLADTKPTFAACAAHLDCAKHFIALSRNTVAVRLYDSRMTAMREFKPQELVYRFANRRSETRSRCDRAPQSQPAATATPIGQLTPVPPSPQ